MARLHWIIFTMVMVGTMLYHLVGGTFYSYPLYFGEIERRCVNKRAQLVVKRRIVKTSNSRGDNTLSHTNSTGAEHDHDTKPTSLHKTTK